MLSVNWKHIQLFKFYMPCNFEINLITRLGVVALFSLFVFLFKHFCLIFQKLLELKVKFKLHKCAAYQDLPTLQFWS